MPHTFSFFLSFLFRSFLPAHPPPPTSLHLSLASFLHAFQDNLLCKKKNYHLTHKPVAPIWPQNRTQWKTTVTETSQAFVRYLGSGANKWPNVLVAEGSHSFWGTVSSRMFCWGFQPRFPWWQPIKDTEPAQLALTGKWQQAGPSQTLSANTKPTLIITIPSLLLDQCITIIWPKVSLHVENLFQLSLLIESFGQKDDECGGF